MLVCKECNREFPEEDMLELNKKMYCYTCHTRLKNDNSDLQTLKNYIYHIFKFRPNKMMLNQIKKYNTENGWSYKNIRLTLEYMVVIREIKMEAKYGIGLVPYYYDDMIYYHKKRLAKTKEIENKKKKSKHITVNKKRDDLHKFNKKRIIDLEGIEDEDE